MENEVVKQWIIKRKYYLIGDFSYRLLVMLKNGKFYFSNGEVGDFYEISIDEANIMINRDL